MKLIYCEACRDIRRLRSEEGVTCHCGASSGQYRGDGLLAGISGPCLPLGIANMSFEAALAAPPLPDGNGNRFIAFVIPEQCDTVHRTDR